MDLMVEADLVKDGLARIELDFERNHGSSSVTASL
jgi:hypothetical protein